MTEVVVEGGRVVDSDEALPPVLVVDDDPVIRRLVRGGLEREGLRVSEAATGAEALGEITRAHLSVVILDLNLGNMLGFDVLSKIRAVSEVPVILLTGRGSEVDRVLGLELGADDYVVKPFSPRELAARVRAVLRRTVRSDAGAHDLLFGELRIDLVARRVFVRGERVELTAREFDLLAFLASSPRHVFSRAEVLEHVWRSAAEWQDPATVTEHVRRLRVKLEDDRENPRWIRTVRAKGYSFEP
jgi:two-component system phosphate regulon response regulator PhoB